VSETRIPPTERLEASLRSLVAGALGARIAHVEWLPGQLGLRRFARLSLAGGPVASLVARVEAPEDPAGRPAGVAPEPPLEPIRALLEREGIPVPARVAADEPSGIELLEDVGDLSLAAAALASSPTERRALYEEACDLVPRLQRVRDPGGVAAFERRMDEALLSYKAELFCEWVAEPFAGHAAGRIVREAFLRIGEALRAAPARLAHRDFQSANVHLRAGRPPGRRLVLLDLQGALLAPPEYDLVCLLRDSYVDLAWEEVLRQLARIRPALPDAPDEQEFAHRFDLLTLSRKGKDLARFVYAARQRADSRYLRFAPPTVRALREAAARAAARDPHFRALAEMLAALPEQPCAR
jgi:aminoglycoside/choline kinase family phosphotransferase